MAGRRASATGRGVVVRHQRHERARDPGTGSTTTHVGGRWDAEGHVAGNGRTRTDAEPLTEASQDTPPLPWLLSARTETALAAQAARLHTHLTGRPDLRPQDVARTLAGRTRFDHRAAVTGADREQLLAGLASLARGDSGEPVLLGSGRPGRTAFLFTGQGAQHPGMGRELAAAHPVFADTLAEVADLFAPISNAP